MGILSKDKSDGQEKSMGPLNFHAYSLYESQDPSSNLLNLKSRYGQTDGQNKYPLLTSWKLGT